jgi:AcrR family transcriptional regulator
MLELMDPVPQGLRERKKLQTRMDLARAALTLFEERGYATTTVEDIAAAANVSRRTFFRYFRSKDEVFIVDPEGKLATIHVALAEGPPEEPTLDALQRGMVAMTAAYWDPELSRRIIALLDREPEMMAAAMAYQVRFADVLAQELATDMGVDVHFDPRPRILAHAAINFARSAVAGWLLDEDGRTPIERAVDAFELGRPALEAILAMPVEAPPMPTEAPVRTA